MAGTSLTADGLLATDTSDMTYDTDDPSKAEEELLMEREWETDLFPDSEQQITNAQAPTTEKTTKTMPQKGSESNSHKPNDNQARGTKQLLDDKRERQGNIVPKNVESPKRGTCLHKGEN